MVDNDEIEEEEEDKTKVNNNESKMMKVKVVKNNKKQVKPINKQRYKSKLSERLENVGVDYEEELSKRKKLETKLWKDKELVSVCNVIH